MLVIPNCVLTKTIITDSLVMFNYKSVRYLNVAGHGLAVLSFQHQLHAAQSVHCLGESTVLLELDVSLKVQMTPETECVEVLVQHLLSVRVQHWDVNISHLQSKQWHINQTTITTGFRYLHM